MKIIIFCLFILILHLLYTKSTYDFSQVYDESVSVAGATNESEHQITKKSYDNHKPRFNTTAGFYVYTSQCRMPFVNPFTPQVRKIFHPKSYAKCAKDEPFITPIYSLNTRRYTLHMNTPIIEKYAKEKNFSNEDISCCYRQIVRTGSGGNVDKSFTLLKCSIFHQDFVVPQHIDYIITECSANSTNLLQKDAFSFIQYRKLATQSNSTDSSSKAIISKSIDNSKSSLKPSILMLGIDSLSRINLRRTMPLTFKYLQTNNWFELQGYNKMGDNTFPNLMAMLTSYNSSMAYDKCQPKFVGGLDKSKCNLIWPKFREFGYRTAYAEDSSTISTFNFLKKGFTKPPTDYYLRPMVLAIEKNLKVRKQNNLPFCVGRKHAAEYIYDYALQFVNVYKDEPYFGFFWTNSFSHNSFDAPTTMDMKMLEYLRTLEKGGVLNRAIVFFFSDHGMRWGPLLKLREGFLEERLPMMFLSLPGWYRNQHPNFIKALDVNRNRLTSPYDIYATLKQILEAGETKIRFPVMNDTTMGISIFENVPEERTCLDAGITEHWCTCVPYQILSKKDKTAKLVSGLIIDEMNKYLTKKGFTDLCSVLKLDVIKEAKLKMDEALNTHSILSVYTISYTVIPGKNNFQATASYNVTNHKISINVEEISRLDKYAVTSKCINEKEAKKYCICKKETKT